MLKEILVTRSSMPDKEEYFEEISGLWETHHITNMGEKHKEFEALLREYLDVKQISLFSNGHMALEMVLQAYGLKGEVITTPFTFASTTHAIVRNGLNPVFCDIREDDFTLDVNRIEELITPQTSAIVSVHVYGNVCDVKAIDKLAKKYNLKVIYDAAHAFGVQYQGKGIGSYGDASMFSFHATKVFNTIEGGAIVFSEDEIGNVLYQLKNFGIKSPVEVDGVGANAKMNEFQAAMGICNLRHIDNEIAKRKKVYERYIRNLKGVSGMKLPYVQQDVESNYAYFPIMVDETQYGMTIDKLCEKMNKNNIHLRRYFFPLTSSYKCYREKYDSRKTPVAMYTAERIAVLPLYADLELTDVDRICHLIVDKA